MGFKDRINSANAAAKAKSAGLRADGGKGLSEVPEEFREHCEESRERSEARKAELAAEAEARGLLGTFVIRKEGKNGTLEVLRSRIVRTVKKTIGKDDVTTIPMKAITGVHHNRRLGSDIVTLTTGNVTYTWKVGNGEEMVRVLEEAMYQ